MAARTKYLKASAGAGAIARRMGVTLTPVRPAAALAAAYEKRLLERIAAMQRDTVRTLTAVYKANPPEQMMIVAADASPASILRAAMRKLVARWSKQFDELAPKLAEYFASQARDRNDRQLRDDLRKAGFTVRFKMTRAMNDAYQAVIGENVGLISSIPEQYMTGVQTAVMQSVQTGRDLGSLAATLEQRYGIVKRRAATIARDQNNKATAVLMRARYLEMGVTRATWLHSAGGKTPRPEHVKFSGETFDVAKGHDFQNGEGIVWPGTAINCRCVMKPVIPGWDD